MASSSWFIARAVRSLVGAFPHDYAVKIARKVRHELAPFTREEQALTSDVGPLYVSGVRRSLGMGNGLDQFEPELLRWIDRLCRDGDVVWDVGGHVGLYSIYLGKKRAVDVYAFEPHTPTYLELLKNLHANGADERVRPLNLALDRQTGFLQMPVGSFEAGFTTTTDEALSTGTVPASLGHQWVATMRGDDFARSFGAAPDHIKLDVDGAEIAVLAGCPEALTRCRSLLVEVIDVIADRFESEVLPLIRAAGLDEVPVAAPSSGRNRVFVRGGTDAVPEI